MQYVLLFGRCTSAYWISWTLRCIFWPQLAGLLQAIFSSSTYEVIIEYETYLQCDSIIVGPGFRSFWIGCLRMVWPSGTLSVLEGFYRHLKFFELPHSVLSYILELLMWWGTKLILMQKSKFMSLSSAFARLGAATTFDGPTHTLLSSRNVSQLPGNSRNRATFFQKQELALFRSHWQACILCYVLCPIAFVLPSCFFKKTILLCSHSCFIHAC